MIRTCNFLDANKSYWIQCFITRFSDGNDDNLILTAMNMCQPDNIKVRSISWTESAKAMVVSHVLFRRGLNHPQHVGIGEVNTSQHRGMLGWKYITNEIVDNWMRKRKVLCFYFGDHLQLKREVLIWLIIFVMKKSHPSPLLLEIWEVFSPLLLFVTVFV